MKKLKDTEFNEKSVEAAEKNKWSKKLHRIAY